MHFIFIKLKTIMSTIDQYIFQTAIRISHIYSLIIWYMVFTKIFANI